MKLVSLILGLLIISLISGCVPTEKQCSVDDDCAEKICCHANEAVNKNYAPDCEGVVCTMECIPGTTDCGQAEIKCVSGECKVKMI